MKTSFKAMSIVEIIIKIVRQMARKAREREEGILDAK